MVDGLYGMSHLGVVFVAIASLKTCSYLSDHDPCDRCQRSRDLVLTLPASLHSAVKWSAVFLGSGNFNPIALRMAKTWPLSAIELSSK